MIALCDAPPHLDPPVSALLARIDAATAALPGRPEAALRELRAARTLLTNATSEPARRAASVVPEVRLTTRESEVLGLLAHGDRNKEIAQQLKLRERTVKFHVANLLQKLNAQSRTEALRRAIDAGLLDPTARS